MIRGIGWGMSESGRLRWEKARRVGKTRFLIVNSLLLRGSILFVGAILFELLIGHQQLNLHLIETSAFVCFLGALVVGLWAWDQNESIRRAFQIPSTKQDRTSGELTGKES